MKISYQLTPEDYIRARRLSMRPRPWLRGVGCVVAALFAAFIIWQGYDIFAHGKPQSTFWMIVGLAVYLPTIYFVVVPWRTRRVFQQQKTLHPPVELDLTETHFSGSSAHGTFRMAWGDFHKWKKNEHLILVYQSALIMQMIPLRAFQSPADVAALTSILEKHLGAEKA